MQFPEDESLVTLAFEWVPPPYRTLWRVNTLIKKRGALNTLAPVSGFANLYNNVFVIEFVCMERVYSNGIVRLPYCVLDCGRAVGAVVTIPAMGEAITRSHEPLAKL